APSRGRWPRCPSVWGCTSSADAHGNATATTGTPRILDVQMTLADRVKQDLTSAMKAGEKERVGALRLVLSELQKDAKEGKGDELAVLRRERKRRHESAAAFRQGGAPDR